MSIERSLGRLNMSQRAPPYEKLISNVLQKRLYRTMTNRLLPAADARRYY